MKDHELRKYLLGENAKLREFKIVSSDDNKEILKYPLSRGFFYIAHDRKSDNILTAFEKALDYQNKKIDKINGVLNSLLELLRLEVCSDSNDKDKGTVQKKGHKHIIK